MKHTISESKRYKGMYYINSKPFLIDNLEFIIKSDRFSDSELKAFDLFLKRSEDKDRVKKIISMVSKFYDTDINTRNRKRNVCEPRQIAMYLSRLPKNKYNKRTPLTLVGEAFGMGHDTVLNAVKNISNWI